MPKEYEEDNTIDFDLDNHVHQEHQLSLQHLITLFYFGVCRTRTRNVRRPAWLVQSTYKKKNAPTEAALILTISWP